MKKSLIIVLSIVCLGDGVVYGALLAIMVAPVQGEAAVVRAVRYPLSPTATAIWRNYQRVIWDGSERTEC
ncbi:MAG TPA: hypothetical protein VLG71_00535, partial [Candidatus Limnocylindria bacterium]|nr:hypothetical protein [Candidatus Limnocylindria bacterium]